MIGGRLAIVTSHPIQYQAPWFRALAKEIDLCVFFCHRQDAAGQASAGFGVAFEWDIPLLDGYEHRWLTNVAAQPGVDTRSGCDTPGILDALDAGRFTACLVNGWYLKSYRQAVSAARKLGLPVLMRGDSQLKTPRSAAVSVAKYVPYRWFLSTQVDAHLYVGAANREYLEHYGVTADHLYFAPHFVENERFAAAAASARSSGTAREFRRAHEIADDAVVFLFAGKLIDKKRPADFIAALARARPAGATVHGLIAGAGPLEHELRQQVEATGARVAFAGFTNQSRMPICYAASDCLVLPSDGRETWGLVVNEAMAAGVPAIVSDAVGCAPDLIAPGDTGDIVPLGDVDRLAQAMERVARRTPQDVASMAGAVRHRIAQYSCDAATAGTLSALRALGAARVPALKAVASGLSSRSMQYLNIASPRTNSLRSADADDAGWTDFPLTTPGLVAASLIGTVVGLLSGTFLQGYAVFALFAGPALVWNRRYPPILAFVIGYQWIAITIGYWYMQVVGDFPTAVPVGDIDRTILLSLTGLLLLALGIRVAWSIGIRIIGTRSESADSGVQNLRRLFMIVVLLYAVDYVYAVNTKNFAGLDVLLDRVLDMRQIVLLVLWFEILRQRRGFTYLWLSLAFVFFPKLGTYFSDFKTPLFMLAVVFAATWRPWRGPWWRLPLAGVKVTPLLVVLLFLALVWQGGGVKKETRRAYDTGEIGGDPLARMSLFLDSTASAVPEVLHDPQPAVEQLVSRMSYVTFFSRVLDYVPRREPFADGELLRMAIENTVMPRFLFPDKTVLPSDSYYTRRFTGVMVNDTDTSISIGYLAEFYADWGITGMFVSVFLFGCWIGVCATVVTGVLRTRQLVAAALIVIFMHVMDFEAQFIKTFAALNISVVMVVGLLWAFRSRVCAVLGFTDGAPEPVPAAAPDAEVPA